MKDNFKLIFLLVMFLLISCYRVKERRYLFIKFNNCKLKGSFLEEYIDSVRDRKSVIPDSIIDIFLKGGKLDDRERIVHFKGKPEEWYLIIFDIEPCWIEYIYNPQLSNIAIGKMELLGNVEINQIEMRFRNEILNPAEEYGKMEHLPDSIIYQNNNFK